MSRFDVAKARWDREVDEVAADLIDGGMAPFAAAIEATRIVNRRRRRRRGQRMTDPAPRSGLQVGDRAMFAPTGYAFISRRGQIVRIERLAKAQRLAVRFPDGLRLFLKPDELTPVASETTEPKRDA
jgi:hypothetical protein